MSHDPDSTWTFAEAYTAAWCSMDPARVAAHYAPDGSLTINGGTPSVGREALTATAQSFYDALPDMQVYLCEVVVDGDRIRSPARTPGRAGRATRSGWRASSRGRSMATG